MRLGLKMKRLWRRLIGNWWVVRRSLWPYRGKYSTYNGYKRCILDTGLTRERAQQICDAMNASESGDG